MQPINNDIFFQFWIEILYLAGNAFPKIRAWTRNQFGISNDIVATTVVRKKVYRPLNSY